MTIYENKLQKKQIILISSAYLVFILFAFFWSGIGANAPVMMAFYQIDAAEQGFILTMQAIGSLSALIYVALHEIGRAHV